METKYIKIKDNLWLNTETKQTFSTELHKEKHGKISSFSHSRDDFLSGKFGGKYYDDLYSRLGKPLPETLRTCELVCKRPCNSFANKKILVVGGGPSALHIDWEESYEHVITSNYSFQTLESINPLMITLTPYVDLSRTDLHDFLNNNESIIGIEPEFLKPLELASLKKFYRIYEDRIFTYLPRYSSCLGVSTRQIILAILLGAKEVHFCGVDSYPSINSTAHTFEKSKQPPSWRKRYPVEFQEHQIIAFWEYVRKIATKNGCIVKNLAEDLEYNCYGFVTKEK